MRFSIRAALLAGTVALGAGPAGVMPAPAVAQVSVAISFDTFHDQLAGYGAWLYSDRWGLVWQPGDVPDDFRPYDTDGHWTYTDDYGWLWVSDYAWGDIAFHYGRWVNDPDDGWLWIPGYTWGPAWVVWRTNNDYIGWMPMPPDPDFLDGAGDYDGVTISFRWNDEPYYGYRRWYGGDYDDRRFARNWIFVGYGHVADRDYRRYAVHDPAQVVNIVRQTKTVVNYTVVNNYVVNKGIDPQRIAQVTHHPITVVPARQVIRHPNLVATLDAGRSARAQARNLAPMGRGTAGSAPPPPPQVVQRLSANAPRPHDRPSAHLFTKAQVSNAALVTSHFHGTPRPSAAAGASAPQSQFHPNGGAAGGFHPSEGATENGRSGFQPGPAGINGAGPSGGSTETMRMYHRGNTGGSPAGAPPEANSGERENNRSRAETMMHREPLNSAGPPPGADQGMRHRGSMEMNRVPPPTENAGHANLQGGPPPEARHVMHNEMNGPAPPSGAEPGGRAFHHENGPPMGPRTMTGNPPGGEGRGQPHGNPHAPPPAEDHGKGKGEKPEDKGPH